MTASLPADAASRKGTPLAEGLLWYFPNALAAVARVSKAGNTQHNLGQQMHHARGKSTDHADCIMRHLIDAGTVDTDGHRHTAKVAWRALALLQEELEREEGAPLPRNARAAQYKGETKSEGSEAYRAAACWQYWGDETGTDRGVAGLAPPAPYSYDTDPTVDKRSIFPGESGGRFCI